MPETITFNRELGIIEVDSYGEVTSEDSQASLALLEQLLRETGTNLVLSDTRRQEATPSTIDVFQFGSQLPRSIRLAVIVSAEQPTADDVSFVSDVAANRGVEIKIFSTREEALKWLLG